MHQICAFLRFGHFIISQTVCLFPYHMRPVMPTYHLRVPHPTEMQLSFDCLSQKISKGSYQQLKHSKPSSTSLLFFKVSSPPCTLTTR